MHLPASLGAHRPVMPRSKQPAPRPTDDNLPQNLDDDDRPLHQAMPPRPGMTNDAMSVEDALWQHMFSLNGQITGDSTCIDFSIFNPSVPPPPTQSKKAPKTKGLPLLTPAK